MSLADPSSLSEATATSVSLILPALVALWVVKRFFGFISLAALSTFGKNGEWQAFVQPLAAMVKTQAETLFGSLSKITVSLDTVILFAILISLVGIWRDASRCNAILLKDEASHGKSSKKRD
jgi:hypothetical protein